MKRNRQERIMELVTKYEIETQEDLIRHLQEEGYDVTQATISRDIREMKLVKMTTGKGTFRYGLPKVSRFNGNIRFNSALTESILSAANAQNIVVMKTYPGMAQAIASGIDHMELQQILGCVAGDDTIIIVLCDNESAEMLTAQVRDLLRNL